MPTRPSHRRPLLLPWTHSLGALACATVALSACSSEESEGAEDSTGGGTSSAATTDAGTGGADRSVGGSEQEAPTGGTDAIASASGGTEAEPTSGGASSETTSGGAGGDGTSSGGRNSGGTVGSGGGSGDGGGSGGAGVDPGSGGSDPVGEPCLDFSEPSKVGDIEAFAGPSGMVASRSQPGVLYVHADAGADPVFFAMDERGTQLARFELSSAVHTDWEDMAVGADADGNALLYIGDIGDNAARSGGTARDDIRLYRFKEPSVALGQEPTEESIEGWEQLIFTYPEAPHDAEALFIDPASGDILFVTKEDNADLLVFRAPGNTPADTATALEFVTQLTSPGDNPGPVSAGDISPSGDRILLRTLEGVLLWPHVPGSSFATTFESEPLSIPAAAEPQGEGISFASDGQSWFSAGEQQSDLFQSTASCD